MPFFFHRKNNRSVSNGSALPNTFSSNGVNGHYPSGNRLQAEAAASQAHAPAQTWAPMDMPLRSPLNQDTRRDTRQELPTQLTPRPSITSTTTAHRSGGRPGFIVHTQGFNPHPPNQAAGNSYRPEDIARPRPNPLAPAVAAGPASGSASVPPTSGRSPTVPVTVTRRKYAPLPTFRAPSSGPRVTKEEIRQVANSLRKKYELDTVIWARKDCEPGDQPEIRYDMERSDRCLRQVWEKLSSWDRPDAFEDTSDRKKVEDIKRRIRSAERVLWDGRGPWMSDDMGPAV